MGWDDYVGGALTGGLYNLGKSIYNDSQHQDDENAQRGQVRNALAGLGQNAQTFSNGLQNNYAQGTQNIGQDRNYLQGLARGQNSVSAEQLRQGMQQGLAAQQSMAAGANPNNAAMAARNAAMNMGRLGYGLSGQQALAGLQERNQAQQQLSQLDLGARGQDLQGALGAQQNATNAYGNVLGAKPDRTFWDQYGGAITGGLQGMMLMSDRRAKTDIHAGDRAADEALKGLKAFLYNYKDQRNGKGQQLGVMAQDLEKAGLGHTVTNAPDGSKMVNGGRLALSLAAILPGIDQRLSKLEDADDSKPANASAAPTLVLAKLAGAKRDGAGGR